MVKSAYNMLFFSDIHFGHNKVKTAIIVKHLKQFLIKYNSYLDKTDIIFISGDVFDTLLSPASSDFILAYRFLTELLYLCKDRNIKLRILEGTPSHDWKQTEALYTVIDDLKIESLDFKYIKELYIEKINDISILYIPDEWKDNINDIYNDIEKILLTNGLNKVDIIVMHGAFKFQLPEFLDNLYDQEIMKKYVNGFIVSGHIHKPEVRDNIIIPGSFERLTFADQDDVKSVPFITYYRNTNEFDIKLLKNIYTLPFKTFKDFSSVTELEKSITKFIEHNKNKELIFIRIEDKLGLDFSLLISDLNIKYRNIEFVIKRVRNKNMNNEMNSTTIFIKQKIDRDIIRDYVVNRLEKDNIEDKELYISKLETIFNKI